MEIKYMGGPKTPGESSPAYYKTDRGTYLIQGYPVSREYEQRVKNLLPNEQVVEIPACVIDAIKSESQSIT